MTLAECFNEPQNGCNLQVLVAHNIAYHMHFAAATPLQSTGGTAQSSATIWIGALVGTAVGALLLGMAIMAFILLGIPRSVVMKCKPDIPH